ncbi:MAG TPA: TolC family protein [Flavisolibacter sp.]|nr:TolC family protein [Flavisolibacter sp.]
MMKKIIVPAMAFLLLNTPTVFAQSKTYSLKEVWQKVLQHYPSLSARKEAVEAQELKKELIKEGFLPDITIQSQQSYGSIQNVPGSFFPLPGMYTTSGSNKASAGNSPGANFYASALLQWNFMQFGRQQKKLAAANAAISVSNTLLKQEEWNLLANASRFYFSALAAHAALNVARADTRRLSELLELLQSQVNAGLRPGADTLLLKSSLLQSKAKEHDFGATLKKSLIQLGALTGDANGDFSIDTTIFSRFQPTSFGSKGDLQEHPYLQLMNARIQAAEADKETVKKEIYPSIGLLAGVGVKGSGISTDGTIDKGVAGSWQNASGTYLAGIGLTWNFASLYQNKTKRAVADRVVATAKAEKEAMQIQLQAQYASALAGWDEQSQKLLAAHASLDASKEAYELYEVRYQSGLLNLIELLQLQKNLQEAESNYVTAVSGYWNELLNQSETLGDPSLILTVIKP